MLPAIDYASPDVPRSGVDFHAPLFSAGVTWDGKFTTSCCEIVIKKFPDRVHLLQKHPIKVFLVLFLQN